MSEEAFVNRDSNTVCTMVDEHELIKISEKTVTVGNIGKIVQGDVNSQILCFEIDRYYDDVDLLNMNFCFVYQTIDGYYKDDAVNVAFSDDHIRFNWVLSYGVTKNRGNILASACVSGIHDGKDYCLKTTDFILNIAPSVNVMSDSSIAPPDTWLISIDNRVKKLERNSNGSSIFVGTEEEAQKAIEEGKLSNNTLLYLSDSKSLSYVENGAIETILSANDIHTHSNAPILDKFSERTRGQVYYEGSLLVDEMYLHDETEKLKRDYTDQIAAEETRANDYTNQKVADLINGAPETLDTIKELADAIQDNKDVETALNEAINKKANQDEVDTKFNDVYDKLSKAGTVLTYETYNEYKTDYDAGLIPEHTLVIVNEEI